MDPLEKNSFSYIELLRPEHEQKIQKIPFLNIDAYIIPSPYIRDSRLEKDYRHSYVWNNEGEILGYFLVYSNEERRRYHIYKQVTSPFGRGKGIGSAFVEKLISEISPDATVYLYIWEKQLDSIDFFESRGFQVTDKIVCRKLTFCHMSAKASVIREHVKSCRERKHGDKELIGEIRHDARKNLQLMLDMINMLSVDNSDKIIEDINRETTALVNLLNNYGDKQKAVHVIDTKELLFERIIPFIESSNVPCEIRLNLESRIPGVLANYVDVGRALVNLISNSLDAILEKGVKGVIEITLDTDEEHVILCIRDNGSGIAPDRLRNTEKGLPAFVGWSTKVKKAGEGYGTRQVFSTFGADNIQVNSRQGDYTEWMIKLRKYIEAPTKMMSELERRYHEQIAFAGKYRIGGESSETEISGFIWHTRRLEILCYDLVFQFSKYNNIRDIYRSVLACRYGELELEDFRRELLQCRIDTVEIRDWLLTVVEQIMHNECSISRWAPFEQYAGHLFKSYGQAVGRTVIFSMDPVSGQFFAADRKLAEHFDFVNYLKKDRDSLLRGEFRDDLDNPNSPVTLGVWSVDSEEDLDAKLCMIQQGVTALLGIGVVSEKRLSFYNTTYNSCCKEIDSFKTTTLGEMAGLAQNELMRFTVAVDDELAGFTFVD
jgi:N-acetylglutamate synthase-like GNAT family acetyltransferase